MVTLTWVTIVAEILVIIHAILVLLEWAAKRANRNKAR